MWIAETSNGENEAETLKALMASLVEDALEDKMGAPYINSLSLEDRELSGAAQRRTCKAINVTIEHQYMEALEDLELEERYIKEIKEYN